MSISAVLIFLIPFEINYLLDVGLSIYLTVLLIFPIQLLLEMIVFSFDILELKSNKK